MRRIPAHQNATTRSNSTALLDRGKHWSVDLCVLGRKMAYRAASTRINPHSGHMVVVIDFISQKRDLILWH